MAVSDDLGNYYRVPKDSRDLNYDKYIDEGKSKLSSADEYNSHNTDRLDVKGTKKLLLKLDLFN